MTPAPSIDRLAVAKALARSAHAAYDRHVRFECDACVGPLCPTGRRLCDAADDAGKRWDLEEARVAGARRW